jgi:ketosteroid isomerase-like protein
MKITLSILCLFFIISCGQDKATDKTIENTTEQAPATNTEPQSLTPLTYPALYSNWEIGKRENMNTVLSLYKAWDESSVDNIKNLFADSVTLDLPGGKRVTSSRDNITDILVKYRSSYKTTANQVISIYPILNKETNDEWVAALLYNKWTYKDNVRDSSLYQDLWKLQNGKIYYMLSLEQTLSRTNTKRLEKLSKDIK